MCNNNIKDGGGMGVALCKLLMLLWSEKILFGGRLIKDIY